MLLSIQNFQSIRSQSLELKGFVSIAGRSDCGKSALRRAIGSLLYNDWDSSFLRDGAKTCHISLELDEQNKIVQTKGSENSYLTKVDGKVKTFDKVGTDTPDTVKALGFSLLETSTEAHNTTITTQLEPLIWWLTVL